MNDRTCPGYACGATLREADGVLCRRCQSRAVRVLHDLPGLSRECDVTAARLDRISGGGHRKKGDDQPLVVKVRFDGRLVTDVVDEILARDTGLYAWADHVGVRYGLGRLPRSVRGGVRTPRHVLVPTAVATLLAHPEFLRWDDQGPDLAHSMWQVRRELRGVIDRPPERTYAGPCQAAIMVMQPAPAAGNTISYQAYETRCKRDLYRKWGADTITCDGYDPDPLNDEPGCGTIHQAVNRDAFLIAQVMEELLPLRLLWESLYVLLPGCTVDWETARKWPRRVGSTPPRLIAHMVTPAGVALYRGSDVLDLAADTMPRRGRRRVTRHAEPTGTSSVD